MGWSHFKEIIYIKDHLKREFYAEMCRLEKWSVRTLRAKIGGMLKLEKFTASHKGQMELYLRWLNRYERRKFDEAPIGLILCSERSPQQIELLEEWYPIAKGGEFRRWYGNHEFVINFAQGGSDLQKNKANLRNKDHYFQEGLNWTVVSSGGFAARYMPPGFLFDQGGSGIFTYSNDRLTLLEILGALNSSLVKQISALLCPTLNFTTGDVRKFPVFEAIGVDRIVAECINLAKSDWDCSETSWDFQKSPLLSSDETVEASFHSWETHTITQRRRMQMLEEDKDRRLINAYGLQDERPPDVTEAEITLTRAGREQDVRRLLSYALGCMMGRYSLDEPGLVYAQGDNKDFDSTRYSTFPADDDGILPLTDTDWFGSQDTTNRFEEFLTAAWPVESRAGNLMFVADSLTPKAGEASLETIRRYLCTEFYGFHLQLYKRRPIYWLFSSGKERAFQALVYLHRYNGGTLSRMRIAYVIPLQSRLSARIDQLRDDTTAGVTTADRKKREKERGKLLRQQEELRIFDEKLRHYADRRIRLDLDEGVKVNYGKFGDLLAEVKTVTGGSDD